MYFIQLFWASVLFVDSRMKFDIC